MKLLLIHGALGSESQMQNLAHLLSKDFEVFSMDLPGHGCAYKADFEYDMLYFKDFLSDFIRGNFSEPIHIFGYSMDGYLATSLASDLELHVNKIICLGTKWQWNEKIAEHEISMLNPHLMEEKAPTLAHLLSERHGAAHWKNVVNNTADMLKKLGKNPILNETALSKVQQKMYILRGSLDKMVDDNESKWAAHHLPNAVYEELDQQKHPIESVDLQLLSNKIVQILKD